MKELKGKVAAVTGAASGLGRSMALAFAAEGMDLALADVDEVEPLVGAGRGAGERRPRDHAKVDVSKAAADRGLPRPDADAPGGVHVVCNNAGVSPLGAVWENSAADWQWILGVNLWGVIHGVRAFAPHLIAQDEGHIVNTASVSGLISPPGSGAYNVTKHAVVALSESLHHDLRERDSRVGVSVLCPAYVPTRHRRLGAQPAQGVGRVRKIRRDPGARGHAAQGGDLRKNLRRPGGAGGGRRDQGERFYILTHPSIKGAIQARMEDILNGRAPRNPLAL